MNVQHATWFVWLVVVPATVAHAATNYVWWNGSETAPYTNWATAATDIQSAVDAAVSGNVVLVASDWYSGYGGYAGSASNVVVLSKAVTVRSVWSPDDVAQMDGPPPLATIYGGEAHRCVYLGHADARLEGFDLSYGFAPQHGGGAYCDGGGTLTRCIARHNRAGVQGGGVMCFGGGTLRNCVLYDNSANYGGGIYFYKGGSAEHVTVVTNRALVAGGGVTSVTGTLVATICNAIVQGNAPQNMHGLVKVAYSCTQPAPAGFNDADGNRTNDPAFVDLSQYDLQLRAGSACVNTASNLPWAASGHDAVNAPRIMDGIADMGAYERTPTHYIALHGAAVWPYVTWQQAATNITRALTAASAGDLVVITNGIYRTIAAVSGPITVPAEVTVRGAAGWPTTIIDKGDAEFVVSSNAVVEGLTISNGYASGSVAGVRVLSHGLVRQCCLAGNVADSSGTGGIFLWPHAQAVNCVICGNVSEKGAAGAMVQHGGVLRGCLVVGNRGSNPLSVGGVGLQPGAAMENCTIVSNTPCGIECELTSTAINCIVSANMASNWRVRSTPVVFLHCATTPSPGGIGIVTNAPLFVNAAAGDWHLDGGSPCINTGTNQPWMAMADDLDGHPRILPLGGVVDMGCYEAVPEPMGGWIALLAGMLCRRRRVPCSSGGPVWHTENCASPTRPLLRCIRRSGPVGHITTIRRQS